MENQLQLWMPRDNFQFQLVHRIAVTGNLHHRLTSFVNFFFADSLTLDMEPLPNCMELRSHHMELQNLPMEHPRHHMDLQSLHMRPLFPPMKPQNPHTEHQKLLMEPQSPLITAQQQCQRQCMHLHLPSTRAHPMERPQPQWCRLPMSGGRQQENRDP